MSEALYSPRVTIDLLHFINRFTICVDKSNPLYAPFKKGLNSAIFDQAKAITVKNKTVYPVRPRSEMAIRLSEFALYWEKVRILIFMLRYTFLSVGSGGACSWCQALDPGQGSLLGHSTNTDQGSRPPRLFGRSS
jgi:hypothetical protein